MDNMRIKTLDGRNEDDLIPAISEFINSKIVKDIKGVQFIKKGKRVLIIYEAIPEPEKVEQAAVVIEG